MTTSVYFDESGYTGRALLDPAQPHFVVASSCIGDDDARELLRRAFPDYQGDEFKFQKLWARRQNRLVEFAKAVGERASDVFVWHVDKRFCVLTKLIDHLLEPVAHERGHDFYKDAYAFKFSNYVHFGLKHIGNSTLYEAVTNAFYAFARDPTEVQLDLLRTRLTIMCNSGPEELRFFFGSALHGALTFHQHSNISTFKDTLEIQVTSILGCVSFWARERPGGLRLLHDQSAAFFKDGSLWRAISSPNVPQQMHPVANSPDVAFPLPVLSTDPVDSRASPGIQLCDVLAGLTAKLAAMAPANQPLFEAILDTPMAAVTQNGIAPAMDFPEGGPPLRTGPDAVDRMVAIVSSGSQLAASR